MNLHNEIESTKVELLENSALPEIDHLLDLPPWTILEQMEAHKVDFIPFCRESIRRDPMTPDEMLWRCYERFCRLLETFRKMLEV